MEKTMMIERFRTRILDDLKAVESVLIYNKMVIELACLSAGTDGEEAKKLADNVTEIGKYFEERKKVLQERLRTVERIEADSGDRELLMMALGILERLSL